MILLFVVSCVLPPLAMMFIFRYMPSRQISPGYTIVYLDDPNNEWKILE